MKNDLLFLFIAGFIGGVLGIAIHRFVYLTYKSNKIYSQQKDLHKPIKMDISEEGITAATSNGSNLSPWENFYKCKQNSEYILLFYSDALFLMLPKNQIPAREMGIINSRLNEIGS